MLSFSGTLVERDSRIAFAAMLDDLRRPGIEGVPDKMLSASTTSKDFADAELKKKEAGFVAPLRGGKTPNLNGLSNQIRSTPVAAASSAAATALICSSLSGPRDRRSRSASLRFSIARKICGAGPPPWARLVSAIRARRASTARRFASRKALPSAVISWSFFAPSPVLTVT